MSILGAPIIDTSMLEPVKRFSGCLGRPESVAPIEHAGCTSLSRTKPCVVFTAREPIAAYAVTTVRFENSERTSPQMMSGGLAGSSIPTDRPITQQSPLVCTQMPNAGGALTTRSPYAHDADADPRTASHQPDCFMYTTDLVNSRIWESLIRDRSE